jgi:hypothetical protein
LRCEGSERLAPLVQPECVGQHARQVNATVLDESQVMLDSVQADPLDFLYAEGIGADP